MPTAAAPAGEPVAGAGPDAGRVTPAAGLPAIGDATTAEPSVVIEELPAEEPVVPTVIRSILRLPKTEIDAATLVVSQSSEETETSPASQVREPVKPGRWRSWASEESLIHDNPQVEEPAEYSELRKASGRFPKSVAWKELEANLVASRELTKLAREKEVAVMKERSRATRRNSWRRLIFADKEPRGPAKLVKVARLL